MEPEKIYVVDTSVTAKLFVVENLDALHRKGPGIPGMLASTTERSSWGSVQ
jgi:hypothetical protein